VAGISNNNTTKILLNKKKKITKEIAIINVAKIIFIFSPTPNTQ